MVVGNAIDTLYSRSFQIRENPTTGPYIVGLLSICANSASDAKLFVMHLLGGFDTIQKFDGASSALENISSNGLAVH